MSEDRKAIITNWMGTISGEETDGNFIKYLAGESENYITFDSERGIKNFPLNSLADVYKGTQERIKSRRAKEQIMDQIKKYRDKLNEGHDILVDAVDSNAYMKVQNGSEGLEIKEKYIEETEKVLEELEEIQESIIGIYNDKMIDKIPKELIEEKTQEYAEKDSVQKAMQKEMLETIAELHESGNFTGIITPSYVKEVEGILNELNYDGAFDRIMGSELKERKKEDLKGEEKTVYRFTNVGSKEKEEFMKEMMEETGVEKEDVVAVVDDFMEAPLIKNSGRAFMSPFSKTKRRDLLLSAIVNAYNLEEISEPEELIEKLE